MLDRKNRKRLQFWKRTSRDMADEQPVNLPITLPSALKPAKPPKGSKWENRHDPSIRKRETE